MSNKPTPKPVYGQGNVGEPGLLGGIDEISVRLPLEQGERLVGKIGDDHGFAAIAVDISGRDTHAGARLAVGSIGESVGQSLFVEHAVARFRRVARLTDPKVIGRTVVGNHETRIAIRTEISRQNAEPGPLFRVQAHFHRHVFEASVPQIAIQLRDGSFERLRTAVIFGTLRRITRTGIELHVVNHRQIEQAVPIVVDKRGTGGPAG